MFLHRVATYADIPALRRVMDESIGVLQRGFLSAAQIEASRQLMGLDTQLIEDGTYFMVHEEGVLAGCGGWGRRATLCGGDHAVSRDSRLLDPRTEAARIRAMYTAPAFARRGVGRFLLGVAEAAAAAKGFRRVEMGATLAGVPLYEACGYETVERFTEMVNGIEIPLIRMAKWLPPPQP